MNSEIQALKDENTVLKEDNLGLHAADTEQKEDIIDLQNEDTSINTVISGL